MALPVLEPGEQEILDQEEKCYRNVHPDFIVDGKITKQAFHCTPSDCKRLSTARSSVVSPKEHYEDFKSFHHRTAGVCAVIQKDIYDNQLRWVDDSRNLGASAPKGHAYIDFRACQSEREIRKKAKALSQRAEMVYTPSSKS